MDPELETRIAFLEKHIEAQDAEIYALTRRVDALVEALRRQKDQIASLAGGDGGETAGSPAEERPPHY
jgi:uncharacterized coiled-coil protein SlyX